MTTAGEVLTDFTTPDGTLIIWKNRYRGHAEMDPKRLLAHPLNAHIHPEFQQKSMKGALEEVGWLDSIKVAVQPAQSAEDGATILLGDVYWRMGPVFNGHMRTLLALREHQPQVPIDFFELSDAEALYALLTYDSIGAQAYMDAQNMSAILEGVRTSNDSVRQLMQRVAREAGLSTLPAHLTGQAPAVVGPSLRDVLAQAQGTVADPVSTGPVVPDDDAPQVARSIQDPNAPAEMEQPGARGKTPQESQMAYLTHSIKQIVLYFSSDEYLKIIRQLDRVGTHLGLDNNTEIVVALLDFYEAHTGGAVAEESDGPDPDTASE